MTRQMRILGIAPVVVALEIVTFANAPLCYYPRDPLGTKANLLFLGHSNIAMLVTKCLRLFAEPLATIHRRLPPVANGAPIRHLWFWHLWNQAFCEQSAVVTVLLEALINVAIWAFILILFLATLRSIRHADPSVRRGAG